jgi:thiamine pyrophosphate-dependent acetolactate synthase large subunit-like protein
LPPIASERFMPEVPSAAPAELIRQAAAMLKSAKHPVILAGRSLRSVEAWNARIALAESIGARVITDLKIAAAFPTDHPLCAGAASVHPPGPQGVEALRAADVIVSFDAVDLAGALKAAGITSDSAAKIIQISVDHRLHNGWSMDYQPLAPVDLFLSAHPDVVIPDLLAAMGVGATPHPRAPVAAAETAKLSDTRLTVEHLARELRQAVGQRAVSLTHLPLSWNGEWWPFRHPLDFLGSDGGGGIGGGPGISVGAALALRGSGRLPVAICGDGDFLMGVTALWTAVHYRIPLLMVVANNRSFFNDELHQERVARARNRPVENRWIGQRMSDPEIDLAAMGRAQGAIGFGPLVSPAELGPAFAKGIAAVEAGQVAVVDVRVEPGYTAATTAMMTRVAN